MNTFRPRLDILPPAQRRVWAEFRTALPSTFVLYGGTALALRTGGRESEDFDFFTNDPIDAHQLASTLPFLKGAELVQAALSTATFLIERQGRVKLSFFGSLSLGRVGEVSASEDTDVRVASLLDLAAQKIRVVQVRAERKDYADLVTLMAQGIPLALALGAAQALYPDFSPLVSLKALSYFEDGDLDRLPADSKAALSKAAQGVRAVDEVPLVSDRLT